MRGDNDVHLLGHVGEFERLSGVVLPRKIREVVVDGALVYREFPGAGAQKYARDGFLAATGTQKPICARDGVPVELNDPPKLPTVPVSRNLQTSRPGLPAKG